VIGRIEIPRLHVDVRVIEGITDRDLERGAGHFPSSADPGTGGNVALAAHRDRFFRALRHIRRDDRIVLETPEGTYRYVVRSTRIVKPSDVGVVRPDTPKPRLTLVTCYPFFYVGHAPKRFIVEAERAS
jgi:sortase A